MKTGTDASYHGLCIQIVSHLIGSPHIAIQVEVGFDISDTEMVTKVIHKHIFCS